MERIVIARSICAARSADRLLSRTLAVLVLAGCESVSGSPAGQDVGTARALFPHALNAARSIDPAARFAGAQMIETDNPSRFTAQYQLDNPSAVAVNPATATSAQLAHAVVAKLMEGTTGDRNVGDGSAEKAAFFFDVSGGLLALVVKASGTITYSRTVSGSGKGAGEVSWTVDSKDASDRFAAANANFNRLRGRSHVVVWDLAKTDSRNAYWQGGLLRASPTDNRDGDPRLDSDAPDYCELADFRVDAVTGTILSHGLLHTRTSGKQGASRCDS